MIYFARYDHDLQATHIVPVVEDLVARQGSSWIWTPDRRALPKLSEEICQSCLHSGALLLNDMNRSFDVDSNTWYAQVWRKLTPVELRVIETMCIEWTVRILDSQLELGPPRWRFLDVEEEEG